MDIQFSCSKCGQHIAIDESGAGVQVQCPKCGQNLIVPASSPKVTIPPPPPPANPPPKDQAGTKNQISSWYYSLDGKRIGPVTDDCMKRLLVNGTLSNETLVWREGFENWLPIGQTVLKQIVKTPPPLSGSAVNNGLVWTLAFFPIWGEILLQFIVKEAPKIAQDIAPNSFLDAMDLNGLLNAIHSFNLWVILIFWFGLNTVFCAIDEHILKKAGHDTKKLGGWLWLVPVYLFKRAKALKQSLGYFITWCVCCLVSGFIF